MGCIGQAPERRRWAELAHRWLVFRASRTSLRPACGQPDHKRVVTTITSDADDYARQVRERLSAAGLRVEADLRNEKINYKVREHSVAKVPVIFVAGRREAEEGTISVRRLGSKERSVLALDEAMAQICNEARPPDLKRLS